MLGRDERARIDAVVERFANGAGFTGYERARKPAHAALAAVYVLDEGYILRARDLDARTEAAFEDELALLSKVGAGMIPWAVPSPLPGQDGARFQVVFDRFWTLHEALPGRVLCPWQALYELEHDAVEYLVATERLLHDMTRGRLEGGVPERFPTAMGQELAVCSGFLSDPARARIEQALECVQEAVHSFERGHLCFVHGDFHYGNVLLDEAGEASGLIDLDWCRVSHPLEDLGYTAMMLLRDYENRTPLLDRIEPIEHWYGVERGERELFRSYLLLYALYDVPVFHKASNLPERERYLETQLALVETLSANV